MIVSRVRGLAAVLGWVQATLAVGLLWLWLACLFAWMRVGPVLALERYGLYSALVAAALVFDFARGGIVSLDATFRDCLRVAFRQTVMVGGCLLVFLVAAKDGAISRLFLFTYLPLLFGLLVLTNALLPKRLAQLFFSGKTLQRTLLVGSAARAEQLRGWLDRRAGYGVEVVGVVADDSDADMAPDFPLLGKVADLERVALETKAHKLIVMESSGNSAVVARCAELCDRLGIRLLVARDLERRFGHRVQIVEDDGVRFIRLPPASGENSAAPAPYLPT